MLNGVYHLIVIVVAVWAIVTGYRKGFLRQLGGVLAVLIGIVAARMLAPGCLQFMDGWLPAGITGFKRGFVVTSLAYGLIYLLAFGIIQTVSFPIGMIMKVFGNGILNMIGGALFRLFKYLMVVSVIYNILAAFNPSGDITRSSRQHDGNVVEEVMKIAPAVMGYPDAEDVGHQQQLEEAKKIS